MSAKGHAGDRICEGRRRERRRDECREQPVQPAGRDAGGGGYLIVWSYNNGFSNKPNYVRALMFAADGTRQGGEITVSTDSDAFQRGDSVTALAGGAAATVRPFGRVSHVPE